MALADTPEASAACPMFIVVPRPRRAAVNAAPCISNGGSRYGKVKVGLILPRAGTVAENRPGGSCDGRGSGRHGAAGLIQNSKPEQEEPLNGTEETHPLPALHAMPRSHHQR